MWSFGPTFAAARCGETPLNLVPYFTAKGAMDDDPLGIEISIVVPRLSSRKRRSLKRCLISSP